MGLSRVTYTGSILTFRRFKCNFLVLLLILPIINSQISTLIEPSYPSSSSSNHKVFALPQTQQFNGLLEDQESTVIRQRKDYRVLDLDSNSRAPTPEKYTFKSPYTWKCINGEVCQRELYNEAEFTYSYSSRRLTNGTNTRVPLDVCWLNCGQYGALWPYPTIKTNLGRSVIPFLPQNVEIQNVQGSNKGIKAMLGYSTNLLVEQLFRLMPKGNGHSQMTPGENRTGLGNFVKISISTQNPDIHIGLTTDESYSLSIASFPPENDEDRRDVFVDINAPTFFGARHAIETLSQLIAYDEINNCLQIVSEAVIYDRPIFPYRGLMIDTGRNFIPIAYLKRMVTAMSYNKLNILHIHLTDTNSFPFISKRVPQMHQYGAYSAEKVYHSRDLIDLILFAKLRGVKVVPELDAPAHAGNGWQWGSLEGYGELAHCINAEPWRRYCGQPPCGQLNPLNNNTYIVLGEIYKDMLEVFDRDLFHMGGDEVSYKCWNTVPEILEWQRFKQNENGRFPDLMELWAYFQTEALNKLKEANGDESIKPIIWTSEMTKRGRRYLDPSDYIIQIWTGSSDFEIGDLLKEGYSVIFSNVDKIYLDHGFGSWLGTDHIWTFKTWHNVYDSDIIKIAEEHLGINETNRYLSAGKILGGEACLWGEKVDQHNMEFKLWPRGSALAERLWSNPALRTPSVNARIIHHRARMTKRGIHCDRLQPESCHLITGHCDDPYNRI